VLFLRVAETQVAVRHHHHAVEAGEIFGREEREVVLLGVELVTFDRRDVEAVGFTELDDGLLGRA
jgi:hypothetical protein